VHVRRFKLYLTSLPCHSCRYIKSLQDITSYIYIRDLAITSTIYPSVASYNMVIASFVLSRGLLLLTSWQLSKSQKHYGVQFHRWCRSMPASTMEICHYRWQ
jgi:hypothetical protein